MTNVIAITDTVGIPSFAEALGVGASAVSNMRTHNTIPAKKYAIVCELCRANGLDVPDLSLFTFDRVSRGAV